VNGLKLKKELSNRMKKNLLSKLAANLAATIAISSLALTAQTTTALAAEVPNPAGVKNVTTTLTLDTSSNHFIIDNPNNPDIPLANILEEGEEGYPDGFYGGRRFGFIDDALFIDVGGDVWAPFEGEEEPTTLLGDKPECDLFYGSHAYETVTITVSQEAPYTFRYVNSNPSYFDDPYLALYSSFNPAAPGANVVGCNDDRNNTEEAGPITDTTPDGQSLAGTFPEFTATLAPGSYTLVMTTWFFSFATDFTEEGVEGSFELWGPATTIDPPGFNVTTATSPLAGGTATGTVNSDGHWTLTATENENYTFTTWACTASNSNVNAELTDNPLVYIPAANATCTAQFTQDTQYIVGVERTPTYGGSAFGSGWNSEWSLTATANPGFTFTNWTCTEEVEGDLNLNPLEFTATSDMTCTANFTYNAIYTISAQANPGAGGSAVITDNQDGTWELVATENPGYDFSGWACDSGQEPNNPSSASTYLEATSNSTCTASFNANSTPTPPVTRAPTIQNEFVTFKPNGGSGSDFVVGANSPSPLSANWFKKAGYVFTGWNTKADGKGVSYADGATFDFKTSVTLYAQWSVVKSKKFVSSFAGNKATLTAAMKKTISTWVKKLPANASIVCQGSTSGAQVTAFDKKLAKKRAKNVCSYAATVKKDLSYTITTNPSSASKVTARHVWMIQQ
jgi:uncharacterized repeat protein (TIGR02543 family)